MYNVCEYQCRGKRDMKETVSKTQIYSTDALCITGIGDFSLGRTFDCGQCFRFDPCPEHEGMFCGVAFGQYLRAFEQEPGKLYLLGVEPEQYMNTWRRFFSFDRDWEAIRADIESRSPILRTAAAGAEGIRILSQDPFEALISFIISQCNNIPRIKGLVRALCESYGEPIRTPDGRTEYSFPTPESILSRPLSDLTALKLGYRDEYIYGACRAVCNGILEQISEAQSTAEAERIVRSIHGIGAKVAACVLLFGFRRYDAFPVDVWMKRALSRLFGGVSDYSMFGPYGGVAQQYMFYCERYSRAEPDKSGTSGTSDTAGTADTSGTADTADTADTASPVPAYT